jgi:hypothetical protein
MKNRILIVLTLFAGACGTTHYTNDSETQNTYENIFSHEYLTPVVHLRNPAQDSSQQMTEHGFMEDFKKANQESNATKLDDVSSVLQGLSDLADYNVRFSLIEQNALSMPLNSSSGFTTVFQVAQSILKSSAIIKDFHRHQNVSSIQISDKAFAYLKAVNSSNRTYATGLLIVAAKLSNENSEQGKQIVQLLVNGARIATGEMDTTTTLQNAEAFRDILALLQNKKAGTAEEALALQSGKSLHLKPFYSGKLVWVDRLNGASHPLKGVVESIDQSEQFATVDLRPAPVSGGPIYVSVRNLSSREYEMQDEVILPDGRKGKIAKLEGDGTVSVETREGTQGNQKEAVQVKLLDLDTAKNEEVRSKLGLSVLMDREVGKLQSYDPSTGLAKINLGSKKVEKTLHDLDLEVAKLPTPDFSHKAAHYSDPNSYLGKFVFVDKGANLSGQNLKAIVRAVNATTRQLTVEYRTQDAAGAPAVVPMSFVSLRTDYEAGDKVVIPNGRLAQIQTLFQDGSVLVKTINEHSTGKVLQFKLNEIDTAANETARSFLGHEVLCKGESGVVKSYNPSTGFAKVFLKNASGKNQPAIVEAALKDLTLK